MVTIFCHLGMRESFSSRLKCLTKSLFTFVAILLLLIRSLDSRQYVSDRLCQNISIKINRSIAHASANSPSTVSYLETHHPAYVNLSEGAKHSFWIQCSTGDLTNITGNNETSGSRDAGGGRRVATSRLALSSGSHDPNANGLENIDSIIDWTLGGAGEEAADSLWFEDDQHARSNAINDDRYDYLHSIAQQCRGTILKQCKSFTIGLMNSQDVAKCPACGLNDLNCENVHQCTSKCGQIKSINYPQNYGNNHRCRWSIRAPNSYYVNLSVIDFDIPSANNASKLGTCIFDYLTLIDGYTGKRIGCYCNENLPPPYIVSPWNELIIQFDTNSETTGRGFYFQYEFMRLELSERIKSQLAPAHDSATFINGNLIKTNNSNNVEQQPVNSSAITNIQFCQQGWQYFRGFCYRAFNNKETLQWYEAEKECTSQPFDSHLVSILDRDEMLVILYWLTNVWNSSRYREYYIGLIDESREGFYKWSDNNPMSYTDWELKPMLIEDETPAQPDGGAYEDCTVIRYSSFSRTSNWHDVPCSLGRHHHLSANQKLSFKWDYVSSYICKSDSTFSAGLRSQVRRPLFSHEFKQSLGARSGSGPPAQTGLLSINEKNSKHTAQGGTESNEETGQLSVGTTQPAEFQKLSKLDYNRYFVCDNQEVISTVLRCDGIAHCRDGSDESKGCDQDCLDWQFKCANGRCISIGYYCDFNDDCGDGSDESRCERHRCKLNEFRCQSGQCIASENRCNLLPDCRDGSDEGRTCTLGSSCNSNSTFQCYNGLCIPQYAVCDFQIDCPGKFHEDEDAATCELLQKSAIGTRLQSSMLSPSSYSQMLEKSHHVSGNQLGKVVFYPANQAASLDPLPEHLFRCKSGNTINISQRCLFEFDKYGYQLGCRDVSHLVDCDTFECPQKDYVKCPNSYCIPWRYVCDGKWDCIMGDDELGCARYACPGQYKCANQSSCILLHQLCDEHRQCQMGDDEWFCDLSCPVGCNCIGQSVSCRGTGMTYLASNYIARSVRKLDLSYNRLGPNLSSSNFDSYHDLGELILSHNEIEVLPPRKFHQLRNLYKLDLSYNQIHSVKRGAFAGLRRVTQLLLESNQQLFLLEPEAFLELSSLQILNISSSRIQSLRKNTFDGLTSLRHLLLRSNMILTVEDGAFRSLSSLVSLDMRGNDIKHFTKSVFNELKSLRNLSTDSFKFCCLMNHQIPADKCLPLPDEISDCEDLLSSVPQRTCIWIAGGIACLGNLIVIIWRYRDRLGQKEREVEQINSTLLLSLACSDLLMGIYLIIIALVDSWYRGRYIENADKWRESPLCNLCGFLSTVSSTVSVLTLVFMAHNRCQVICGHLNMSNKFTLGYTHRLITVSWLMALTVATVPLLVWPYFRGQFYARSGVCLAFHITSDQRAAGWLYSILVSPCFNLIAFLYIFKCYIGIYAELSKHATRNRALQHSSGSGFAQFVSQFKIMLIVLVHFVAFSPPIIIGFISLAGYTPPAALYSWIAVLVLPVNSAINPMIYTIPNIRVTIDLLIRNYRARKSGSSVSAVERRAAADGTGATPAIGNNIAQQQQHSTELLKTMQMDLVGQKLTASNIPPGYMPLRQYVKESKEVNAERLVEIALEIASDIEQKHRDSKIYASLEVDDIFVSDQFKSPNDDPKRRVAVFLTDYCGYRQRRSQPCNLMTAARIDAAPKVSSARTGTNRSSNNTNINSAGTASGNITVSNHHHGHRHHKTQLNCECHDVTRFGDILFKLIQLYNSRRASLVSPQRSEGSGNGTSDAPNLKRPKE